MIVDPDWPHDWRVWLNVESEGVVAEVGTRVISNLARLYSFGKNAAFRD